MTEIRIRVIEYVLDDPARAPLVTYRLITTLLDPDAAPAAELAVLYCDEGAPISRQKQLQPTARRRLQGGQVAGSLRSLAHNQRRGPIRRRGAWGYGA